MLTQRPSVQLKYARRSVRQAAITCQLRSVRTLAVQVDGPTASTNSVDVSALASTDPALSSVQLSTASAGSVDVDTTRTPWFKKSCGLADVTSLEELEAVISPAHNGGKMSVVDFYAGWCSSCKAAFPALCRIPTTATYAKHYNFYKANIELPDMQTYIKRQGVRGIPHVLVFDAQGNRLIGMGASFKKMEALRKNLEYIAESDSKDFVLDPNGFVIHR